MATEAAGTPNLFGLDLSAVELRADDLEWSSGSGALVTGPAQVLALAACGRLLPPGRLRGEAALPLQPAVNGWASWRPSGRGSALRAGDYVSVRGVAGVDPACQRSQAW